MILAMIQAIRSGPPGLNGRRRTRDWSGLRIVDVRLTWIDMGWLLFLYDDWFLETRQYVLR